METNNSSIIPKEATLARLGRLIDSLNNYDQHVSKLLDEIEVSCVSPFAIPGWPRNFHMDESISIRKEILYPSRALGGINLTRILANIKVYISGGYLHIHTEQVQDQTFKLFGIRSGQEKRVRLESYHSCPRIDPHDCGLMDNHPIDIACCLIIFCQLIDEVCGGIEKELQEQLVKKGAIAEQCRETPAIVKRCFEPLVPFVVANALAQEKEENNETERPGFK